MMKKTGKKVTLTSLNKLKNYKVHFGTIDKRNTKTLYVSMSSWVTPKLETNLDYDKIIRKLNKSIKDYLYNNLDVELFENRFSIIDLDLRVSGIKFNKKSFMNCELILYKKNDKSVESEIIQEKVQEVVENITNNIFESNLYFSFNKNKK